MAHLHLEQDAAACMSLSPVPETAEKKEEGSLEELFLGNPRKLPLKPNRVSAEMTAASEVL